MSLLGQDQRVDVLKVDQRDLKVAALAGLAAGIADAVLGRVVAGDGQLDNVGAVGDVKALRLAVLGLGQALEVLDRDHRLPERQLALVLAVQPRVRKRLNVGRGGGAVGGGRRERWRIQKKGTPV